MKTVFNNAQTAHVWAQQTQDQGRSTNGNLFFRGKVIYSYGHHFPLAMFVPEYDIVLVNSDSYSVSTSKHQGYVRQTIKLGHFQIDEINQDGTVKAGCHIVHYDEISSIAEQLGIA